MKEFIINNFEVILTFVTMIVTYTLGYALKKSKKFSNKNIPIINIVVMLIMTLIYYFATGNWSAVVAAGSPVVTLFYDFMHNYNKKED